MAGSFMARLRERMEQLQAELEPDAGFDRRAYGYGDDGERDAIFEDEEAALEEESPWRRPRAGEAPADPVASAPDAGLEGSPWRRAEAAPPAPPKPVTRAARAGRFDPFAVGERQSGGGGARRAAPSPPSRQASAPGSGRAPASSAAGARSGAYDRERKHPRRASRAHRLRARLRQPESLRELFLLREVIDRPIALRRPRHRR